MEEKEKGKKKKKVLYQMMVQMKDDFGKTVLVPIPPSNLATQRIQEECFKKRLFDR
jgi:hypothetical protein